MVTVNLFAIVAILTVCLLGISPAASAEEAGGKVYELKNEPWNLSIQPSTLEVIARPKKGQEFALSLPISDAGPVENINKAGNIISWEVPDKGAEVEMELGSKGLQLNVRVKDPVVFTWPRLRMDQPVKGLIWPHWEGSYIPADDPRWVARLLDWGSVDTLEGLSLPFWGLDCGEYSLTYIIKNRYNNTIEFSKEQDQLVAEFSHDFPPNHSSREYGFLICLGENKTPVEPALIFRQWLMEQGEFVSLKEKMEKTPKVERLPGAAQVYLWGDAYLAKNNVRSPKSSREKVWKPFTGKMIAESESSQPTVGKHLKKLMGEKNWTDLIVEMSKVPYDYDYLQKGICREISRLLGLAEFYDSASWEGVTIPEEAKVVLASDRSSLSPKELARMNGLLLQAAYPEYLAPVNEWGGSLSIAMLKELKEAGFDRMRLCLDGWEGIEKRPEVARYADELGYLFGTYDSFHSIHPPSWQGTDATWPTAQFNQELYDSGGVTLRNGEKKKGFRQKGYILSPIAARPDVEERVNRNFSNVPYNYYFVDCDAYGHVYDDYTPGRTVTMKEGAMARNDRLAWIRDTHHVVIGSEGGCSYAAPVIHVAEGMFLPTFGWGDADLSDKDSEYYEGGWYPPDAPAIFFKPSKLKEEYRYFYLDPRFRLPLYEIVFHDSVVTTSHWLKGNLKYPQERDLIFLTQLLYQVPPLYHVNIDEFKKRKEIMKEQYDFFSALHRELGFSPMTDFSWLTEDRLVQKTVFDDKVEMVANFSGQDFKYQEETLPAGSVMAHWLGTGETKIYTAASH
jgi:hypothetical protein